MTNHSETTGPFEGGGIPGEEPPAAGARPQETQVTLRTAAELADALPYLLGYRPEDSMVLVALHDREGQGRFGGRARLGIPASEEDWEAAARQLARGLVTGSERRGARPEQMVAYVCQEPAPGESGRDVKRRLEGLAHRLRVACGDLDVPVIEALCVSGGRFWSYCCPVEACCPDEGTPMGVPGTSVLAAAATYAGIQVRGTLKELRARLRPWETTAAAEQETALDEAGMALVPRLVDGSARVEVAEETLDLAERIIRRFAAAAPVSGTHPADLRDDDLLGHHEAATLILGLQDRTTRDRAAAWMEGEEAAPALRLWRALARRCVGPYGEHAAAPLTLAGWVAWSTGDDLEAREALAMALAADPDYLFARLLHQACNEGLDPESVRRCLRTEGSGRTRAESATPAGPATEPDTAGAGGPAAAGPGPAPDGVDGPGVAVSVPGVRGAVARGAVPAPGAGVRRRRRVRFVEGGDGSRAVRRAADGWRRPAGSHPRPPAAEPSRPGGRGASRPRTRTAGRTGGAPDAGGHHGGEGGA
ncbi:hypothetical protein GCM10010503_53550 [Streptomyces lucensis JCM 4490]|uniref:DUF4192 domain-containing protein n=1 Tax=Streptomyces lucensis JCM 4490 TaxID=1306176 RepID=A0A918JD34_9ACTN|nr:DUF4192 domain-containing protein [Streptomyces lucensis]GGW69570.1 hypothetical protein GCM10010503_53550 [Streptomyces lucensis JCM 4490]